MSNNDIPVLIVDDNQSYREAFTRNLAMMEFDVKEADNSEEALRILDDQGPMVVVTDLQMRTETEGLDLIKTARDRFPLLPMIMISAVGTFEEGALAQKLGADHVIHKSTIEDEIETLYERIKQSYQAFVKNDRLLARINELRGKEALTPEDDAELVEIMLRPDIDSLVKGEAYDLRTSQQSTQLLSSTEKDVRQAMGEGESVVTSLAEIDKLLLEELPHYESLEQESKNQIQSAEFLYQQQVRGKGAYDFSRSIGFSFCFAVENEVKSTLKRKIHRFLSHDDTYQLIEKLLDDKRKNLDIFFHQYLLQTALNNNEMEITTENVKQTLQRILQHQVRYKPDGLKAVGIMLICFGQEYNLRVMRGAVKVENPLGMKFADGSDSTVEALAEKLIALQHFRNPYIHPEISDMQNISKVRDCAFDCLKVIKDII
ncbi:response regulator [Candidatus Sumerlaeota bacterium]|nr:response regulator [Candidatus Sumerlaeota bacterium]